MERRSIAFLLPNKKAQHYLFCDLETLPRVSRQSKEALDLSNFTRGTMVELQLYE